MSEQMIDPANSKGAFSGLPQPAKLGIWISLVVAASFLFSWALACATPFAALAAVAALSLSRRDALLLIGALFLVNQAIGFFVLDYPRTFDSYGWGVAIGVAAFAAVFAAFEAKKAANGAIAAIGLGFIGAFVAYELVLIATTLVLPAGGGFTLAVIGEVFAINLLAMAALVALHRLASIAGLVRMPAPSAAARG